MSKIGKKPIEIPEGVTVEITEGKVLVKGSKGELFFDFNDAIGVKSDGKEINVALVRKTKESPALWGTTRASIANMIQGVTEGFEKKLELVGVGYRVKQVSNNEISMTLGFSHPVEFKAPEGVEIKVEDNTHITVRGIDKSLVGLAAALIRKFRKPEPYKGKGIRYQDEIVRRKPGKAGKVGVGA